METSISLSQICFDRNSSDRLQVFSVLRSWKRAFLATTDVVGDPGSNETGPCRFFSERMKVGFFDLVNQWIAVGESPDFEQIGWNGYTFREYETRMVRFGMVRSFKLWQHGLQSFWPWIMGDYSPLKINSIPFWSFVQLVECLFFFCGNSGTQCQTNLLFQESHVSTFCRMKKDGRDFNSRLMDLEVRFTTFRLTQISGIQTADSNGFITVMDGINVWIIVYIYIYYIIYIYIHIISIYTYIYIHDI